jgi:hypothetical protein
MDAFGLLVGHLCGDYLFQDDWQAANKTSSTMACAVHCTLYTLAVWIWSFWWMPWWGLLLCWLAHFPLDRWRLARRAMRFRHEGFATGALSPWSIIVVDNTLHLLTLFGIALLAGR